MRRMKANAARRLMPLLDEDTLSQLAIQKGLSQRVFWMRSFRSMGITRQAAFDQKVNYIHENPGQAGLCERDIEYRWSSAWAWEAGDAVEKEGTLNALILRDFYAPQGLIPIGAK
jgi:hypothetical protein